MMHKLVTFSWLLISLVGAVAYIGHTPAVLAQDGATELVFGEWVSGYLDFDDYDDRYTFEGKAGDIVLIEMYAIDASMEAELVLWGNANPNQTIISPTANPIQPGSALLVHELPANDTYTLLATRPGREGGMAYGNFVLRAQWIQLATPDTTLTASVPTIDTTPLPLVYVIRVDQDTTWNINYAYETGSFELALHVLDTETHPIDTFVMGFKVSPISASSSPHQGYQQVDLVADKFYILSARYWHRDEVSNPMISLTFSATDTLLPVASASPPQIEAEELVFDEWLTGTTDGNQPRIPYKFEGKAGDIVLIELYRAPDQHYLDTSLTIYGSSNSDEQLDALSFMPIVAGGSTLVYELPADDTYIVMVGARDFSYGDYMLRASWVEPIQAATELTAAISTAPNTLPALFIIRVDQDATWVIQYTGATSDFSPSLALRELKAEPNGDIFAFIFEIYIGVNNRGGSQSVHLTANTFYILSVQNNPNPMAFDPTQNITTDITLTVSAAE